MEFAASTGTLQQTPKAILQSGCFLSAQDEDSSCLSQLWTHSSLGTEGQGREGCTCSSLHLYYVYERKNTHDFSVQGINFQNASDDTKGHLDFYGQFKTGMLCQVSVIADKIMPGAAALLFQRTQAFPTVPEQAFGLAPLWCPTAVPGTQSTGAARETT